MGFAPFPDRGIAEERRPGRHVCLSRQSRASAGASASFCVSGRRAAVFRVNAPEQSREVGVLLGAREALSERVDLVAARGAASTVDPVASGLSIDLGCFDRIVVQLGVAVRAPFERLGLINGLGRPSSGLDEIEVLVADLDDAVVSSAVAFSGVCRGVGTGCSAVSSRTPSSVLHSAGESARITVSSSMPRSIRPARS